MWHRLPESDVLTMCARRTLRCRRSQKLPVTPMLSRIKAAGHPPAGIRLSQNVHSPEHCHLKDSCHHTPVIMKFGLIMPLLGLIIDAQGHPTIDETPARIHRDVTSASNANIDARADQCTLAKMEDILYDYSENSLVLKVMLRQHCLLYFTGIKDFKKARNNGNGNPSCFNWKSDKCSIVPDKPYGYDFTLSCYRHDFGRRNYEKLNKWPGTALGNKLKLDTNFMKDLKNYCFGLSGLSKLKIPHCLIIASDYYAGVLALNW